MNFRKQIFIAALLVAFSQFDLQAQDASTLLKKMDDVMFSPKDKQGKVEMYLVEDADGIGGDRQRLCMAGYQLWLQSFLKMS